MTIFKAALLKVLNRDTAVVWIDSKHHGDEEYIRNTHLFYKKLFDKAEVVIMVLDEKQHPVYFGKREIIAELKKIVWKKLNWQEFSLQTNK
ncbi:MAG: hypothetical protein PHY08_03780 [Candidatus Cloacimonetes bacterium]|jgi:hypothetical protein|nr:hypothetical protein [Candidatus Cloacimonadota bacterium]MDD4155672.1 hypothetical protein [Candidatus Cloacimonadota bacterium]